MPSATIVEDLDELEDGLGALESGEVTSEGDAGLDGSEFGLHGSESGDLLGHLPPLGRDVSLELGDSFGPGHLGLQRQTKNKEFFVFRFSTHAVRRSPRVHSA